MNQKEFGMVFGYMDSTTMKQLISVVQIFDACDRFGSNISRIVTSDFLVGL